MKNKTYSFEKFHLLQNREIKVNGQWANPMSQIFFKHLHIRVTKADRENPKRDQIIIGIKK